MRPMATIEREALVTLTESAATKVKELMAEEPEGEATVSASRSRAAVAPASSTPSGSTREPRKATTRSTRSACRSSSTRSARPICRGPRSTSSTASRAGSRSTTRTSPRRAAAATRSRSKRAPEGEMPAGGAGCGSGCCGAGACRIRGPPSPSVSTSCHAGLERRRKKGHRSWSAASPGRGARRERAEAPARFRARSVNGPRREAQAAVAGHPRVYVERARLGAYPRASRPGSRALGSTGASSTRWGFS